MACNVNSRTRVVYAAKSRALLRKRCISMSALSPSQCAGINRHEAGNARVLRERSSEPLGPEFCVGHREVHGEA